MLRFWESKMCPSFPHLAFASRHVCKVQTTEIIFVGDIAIKPMIFLQSVIKFKFRSNLTHHTEIRNSRRESEDMKVQIFRGCHFWFFCVFSSVMTYIPTICNDTKCKRPWGVSWWHTVKATLYGVWWVKSVRGPYFCFFSDTMMVYMLNASGSGSLVV